MAYGFFEWAETSIIYLGGFPGDSNSWRLQVTGGNLNMSKWIGAAYVDQGNLTTDHGSLSGLGDDDHSQYHNDTRGDARYYQLTQNCLYEDKLVFVNRNFRTVAGTWTPTVDVGQEFNYRLVSAGADAEEIFGYVPLESGNWNLYLVGAKDADHGIVDVLVDDVVQGSVDLYAAAPAKNQASVAIPIVLATSGRHKIGLKVNGKNGASSSFIASITYLSLVHA